MLPTLIENEERQACTVCMSCNGLIPTGAEVIISHQPPGGMRARVLEDRVTASPWVDAGRPILKRDKARETIRTIGIREPGGTAHVREWTGYRFIPKRRYNLRLCPGCSLKMLVVFPMDRQLSPRPGVEWKLADVMDVASLHEELAEMLRRIRK